ncbi:hypothetical protein P7C73_g3233, partial [Tremellales sp. Uapishka_1]
MSHGRSLEHVAAASKADMTYAAMHSRAGGFVPEPSQPSEEAPASVPPAPLLHLTPRQQSRLVSHLDGQFLALERDDHKHAFVALPALLDRLSPLLTLILQIPPLNPFSYLRTAYLLNFTGVVVTYIVSLPLDAPETLVRLLRFIQRIDEGGQVVLRGQAWVPKLGGVKVDFAGQVDQTERIRLRSMILSSREKMIAWARVYGHFKGDKLPGLSEAESDAESLHEQGEWETQIVGMWNGTLELLSGFDLERDAQDV